MNAFLLHIVIFLHMMVVFFVLLTPFTNNNMLIFMHAITVPFIMAHWYINDNQCVLSTAEKHIRKHIDPTDVDQDNCFTCSIINPIYDFKANNEDMSTFIYTVTTVLWTIGLYKLYCAYKSGEIKSIYSLFNVFHK